MATPKWIGGAMAVRQVTTVTVTAYDTATTYKLLLGGNKFVSVLGTGGSTATTATALSSAASTSDDPEFQEITWSVNGSTITATGPEDAGPFTLTSSASGGTGTIGAASTTTTASGPHHWSEPLNWSTGAIPANGDTAVLQDSDDDIKYGLAQSGVTLAALRIYSSFTGTLGLPDQNANGYTEYRATELAIGATVIRVGDGQGDASGRIRINTGSVTTQLIVLNTASGLDDEHAPLEWRGTSVSNVIDAQAGQIGVAVSDTQSATVATMRVGGASVRCGPSVTLTTIKLFGGFVELNGPCTTITIQGGGVLLSGTGAYTTITNDGGSVAYRSTGTITTLTLGHGGSIDFGQDQRPRTITNTVQMYAGSALTDDAATVTFSATPAVTLNRCGIEGVTLRVGLGRSVTVS